MASPALILQATSSGFLLGTWLQVRPLHVIKSLELLKSCNFGFRSSNFWLINRPLKIRRNDFGNQ